MASLGDVSASEPKTKPRELGPQNKVVLPWKGSLPGECPRATGSRQKGAPRDGTRDASYLLPSPYTP